MTRNGKTRVVSFTKKCWLNISAKTGVVNSTPRMLNLTLSWCLYMFTPWDVKPMPSTGIKFYIFIPFWRYLTP